MTEIPEVSAVMHQILTVEANNAAFETGFIQRQRQVTGAGFVQALVSGWLANPQATIEQLAQSAANVNMPISPQGLEQRFSEKAATCLQAVLAKAVTQMIQAKPVAIPILQRFIGGVYVLDSTTIVLPPELQSVWQGCGGHDRDALNNSASLKIQTMWNLANGELRHVSLNAGRASDQGAAVQGLVLPTLSLRVADLGYFGVSQLSQMLDCQNYALSRFKVQTALYDEQGQRLELLDLLKEEASTKAIDLPVWIGATQYFGCRLLAFPVPQDVADQRWRRIKWEAKKDSRKPNKVLLELAAWTILITTAPAHLLSLDEALVLQRARWQIELLFKLWKSVGQVDEWRSKQPWRILCEVYAKLLGMLVTHWIVLISVWKFPNRSLTKATQSIQQYARSLARAVSKGIESLIGELTFLKECLAKSCRMNKCQQKPNTYQLLLDLIEN